MSNLSLISSFTLPTIIVLFGVIMLSRRKDYFCVFINGAKEGIRSTLNIIPTLCLLITGVSMLTSSGAINILEKLLDPIFSFLKIPVELLTLIITRPLSSGASIAAFEDIIKRCGVDSYEALCASVIMASSDTAFYVIAIYFSTTEIKKTRHAIPCALLTSALSIVLGCMLCSIFFE